MLRNRKSILRSSKLDKHDKAKGGCPFCGPTEEHTIKSKNDLFYIIKNRVAYNFFEGVPVIDHLMVIPKRHVTTLADMTDAEKIEYVTLLGEYEKRDYSVYSRSVESGIRSVAHVHTHLLKNPGKRVSWQLYIEKPYLVISGKQMRS